MARGLTTHARKCPITALLGLAILLTNAPGG